MVTRCTHAQPLCSDRVLEMCCYIVNSGGTRNILYMQTDLSVSSADFFFCLAPPVCLFALSDALDPIDLGIAECRRQCYNRPPLEQQRDKIGVSGKPREPGRLPSSACQFLKGRFFFFFESSGGWGKITLKLPHFHAPGTRRVSI